MSKRGRTLDKPELAKIRSSTVKLWEHRVEYALRHLGDRSVLNRSPLARLSYIERLSNKNYNGHLLPRGLALHDTLITCVDRVLNELNSEPGLARACNYLKLIINGATCREISRQLGLSREHISRVYRKQAIELVTEEFLAMVNGK